MATEILKLSSHVKLGEIVTSLVDDRLSHAENKDDPLAALLLVVIEEQLAHEKEVDYTEVTLIPQQTFCKTDCLFY